MKLLTYLTAAKTDIKAAFPEIKDIDTHAGRLTEQDIKKLMLKAPALRIALLGSSTVEARLEGTSAINCKFGCFIVTKNGRQYSKDEQAMNIAEALIVFLDRFQPKGADAKMLGRPAKNLRYDVLLSAGQNSSGTMLSAVSWEAVITTGQGVFEESGPVLSQLYVNDEPVLEVA